MISEKPGSGIITHCAIFYLFIFYFSARQGFCFSLVVTQSTSFSCVFKSALKAASEEFAYPCFRKASGLLLGDLLRFNRDTGKPDVCVEKRAGSFGKYT